MLYSAIEFPLGAFALSTCPLETNYQLRSEASPVSDRVFVVKMPRIGHFRQIEDDAQQFDVIVKPTKRADAGVVIQPLLDVISPKTREGSSVTLATADDALRRSGERVIRWNLAT